jgi:hypothetical protein
MNRDYVEAVTNLYVKAGKYVNKYFINIYATGLSRVWNVLQGE